MSDALEIVEELEPETEVEAQADAETETKAEGEGEQQAIEGEQEDTPPESSTEKEGSQGVQKRIDELTRARRQAERERDYYQQLATEKPLEEVEPPKVKTLEDFDYDEGKYQAYLFQESRNQAVQDAKRMLQEEQNRAAQARKLAAFEETESSFAKDHKDYMDVTRDPSLAYTQEMHEIVTDLDSGPDVMYYLGKNKEVAARIARMPHTRQAIELGRIEERLTIQKSQKGPSVTKAAEPPPNIRAASASQAISPVSADSDKLSTEEWLKRRRKQLARK